MSAAEAYKAAQKRIAEAKAEGTTSLNLSIEDLDRIPPEIADLTEVVELLLDGTQVADISPLSAMTAIQSLYLSNTQVADISPLSAMTGMQTLDLEGTQVADIAALGAMTGMQRLYLNYTQVADISPLSAMTAMQSLYLSNTQVADISPLSAMTGMQTLDLDGTQVADISPLGAMTGMQSLYLSNTQVADVEALKDMKTLNYLSMRDVPVTEIYHLMQLTALARLDLEDAGVLDPRPILGMENLDWLDFLGTPAASATKELEKLGEIRNGTECAEQTKAYLKTLPPWPEPVEWDTGETTTAENAPIDLPDTSPVTLTVEQVIDAQDDTGWRFSPTLGALELFVRDIPLEERQNTLAQLTKARLEDLLQKLGTRNDQGGFRQEVHDEATRFNNILGDNSQTLAQRSLSMWTSLIALGALLDGNDAGRVEGRDPLDLLNGEARASLQTLLGVSASLVRSFPEARALDDDLEGFTRQKVSVDVLLALIEKALAAKLVDAQSGDLMQRISGRVTGAGAQNEKADKVSKTGLMNLVVVASLLSGSATAVGSALLTDIVTDLSNHYELGEKSIELSDAAIEFLTESNEDIENLLAGLSPDEKARLRSIVEDALNKAGPR